MSIEGSKSTPWLDEAEPQKGVLLPSSVTAGLLQRCYGDVIIWPSAIIWNGDKQKILWWTISCQYLVCLSEFQFEKKAIL